MSDAGDQIGEPIYRLVIDFADAPPGVLKPTQRGALELLGPVLRKFRESHPGIRIHGTAYPLSPGEVAEVEGIPVGGMKRPYVLQFTVDWAQIRSIFGACLIQAMGSVITQKVRKTGTKGG